MSTLYVDNLQPNLGSRVLASGHVVQVVSATTTSGNTITSTSYVDTGITASITPTNTSNKILILVSSPTLAVIGNNNSRSIYARLLRDATQIALTVGEINSAPGSNSFNVENFDASFVYLDSPSTTSSITYKTQAYVSNSADSMQVRFQFASTTSSITLMEIAQ